MLKKLLILLSSLFMFSCTNVATDGVDETKEDQMARLLEEANKVKTVKKTVINEKGEEVVVEEEVITESGRRSHAGMTRGEIMEYEMTRISDEMNALQADVQQYQEKKAQLKAYQEKLEKLEKLNNAGLR